jgi:prolyl 4-hydroxylase
MTSCFTSPTLTRERGFATVNAAPCSRERITSDEREMKSSFPLYGSDEPSHDLRSIREPTCIDAFLSDEECGVLLTELRFTLWRPSLARLMQETGSYADVLSRDFRVSETAIEGWFTKEMDAVLDTIEARLQRVVSFDRASLELWQATEYGSDGHVSFHLDSGYWEGDPSGDRVVTFLIYLTTPGSGGSTLFPKLDLEIHPKAGRLVMWGNLLSNGDCDPRMVHAGEKVTSGRKVTLLNWVRERPCRGR